MKKTILLLTVVSVMFSSCRSAEKKVAPAISQDKATEAKIEKILSKMTLEEKVGQMTQLTVGAILEPGTHIVSKAGEEIIRKYKIGSILNTMNDRADSASAYRELIRQIQDISLDEMGIPTLYGLDQIHGASYTVGAVLFPQEIALAASFNDALLSDGTDMFL